MSDFGIGALQSPPANWQMASLEDRFWSRVVQTPDCWLWIGTANAAGYGSLRHNNVRRQATAVAWFLAFGEYPSKGLWVLHKCDNPRCVRSDHLFLGTPTENMRDMDAKGRARRPVLAGENNPRARLTWADVREIRQRFMAPRHGLRASLAREFGVSAQLIGMISKGQIWRGDSVG